jgi:hypothetical protein
VGDLPTLEAGRCDRRRNGPLASLIRTLPHSLPVTFSSPGRLIEKGLHLPPQGEPLLPVLRGRGQLFERTRLGKSCEVWFGPPPCQPPPQGVAGRRGVGVECLPPGEQVRPKPRPRQGPVGRPLRVIQPPCVLPTTATSQGNGAGRGVPRPSHRKLGESAVDLAQVVLGERDAGPSRFSLEYRRMVGAPRQDVAGLRIETQSSS